MTTKVSVVTFMSPWFAAFESPKDDSLEASMIVGMSELLLSKLTDSDGAKAGVMTACCSVALSLKMTHSVSSIHERTAMAPMRA